MHMGCQGESITGTDARTGRFGAIQFKEDTVINAITADSYTGDSLAGETFVADTVIYGVFTSIQLTSGAAIAYKL